MAKQLRFTKSNLNKTHILIVYWTDETTVFSTSFGTTQTMNWSIKKTHKNSPTWQWSCWFRIVLQPQDVGTLQPPNRPWTLKHSGVKGQKPSVLTAEVWPEPGYKTGQWSQAQEQIYNRTAEREKNRSPATTRSPDLDLIKMLRWDFRRALNTNACKPL